MWRVGQFADDAIVPWRPIFLTLFVGLAVGAATSFGQAHLDQPLNALVNSASAWLVAPFFLGAAMTTLRGAALAGFVGCLLQVVGYYVTAELRGFSAGGAIVAFWLACAVVGGPVFGAAGHLWRAREARFGALAGTVLPAAFLSEGPANYLVQLGYVSTAVLWFVIGAALAVLLMRDRRDLRWLPLTVAIGAVGQVIVVALTSRPM